MKEIRPKRLKIAIFTDTYAPEVNGVAHSIDRFSKLVADDGHKVMIFCPKHGRYRDKSYPRITVKRYSSITAPTYKAMKIALPFVLSVRNDLKKFKPDLVHIQTPMGIGWIGIWATKILKLKNVQTYHTYIPDFLVYLKPKTFLGFNLFVNYLNSSKIIKVLLETDVSNEDKSLNKLKTSLSEKLDEVVRKAQADKTSRMTERFARDLTRAVYNRADLVLTPSRILKRILKKNGVKSEVEVLSNGIEFERFEKKSDYSIQNKLIHVGRLGHEKHLEVVIRALKIALKTNDRIILDVIGEGPARKPMQRLAKQLKLSNHVRFLGFKKREDLVKFYCQYDAFVTASTIETQGIVILEAMAAGLPIIGVKKLAVPEVVKDSSNGYLSRPFNEKEMAKNILLLLSDEGQLEKFGKKSLSIAKSHEIVKCKEKLENYYYKIASLK
jgi:glycosyltransferase involved in cell wall biosynthesis